MGLVNGEVNRFCQRLVGLLYDTRRIEYIPTLYWVRGDVGRSNAQAHEPQEEKARLSNIKRNENFTVPFLLHQYLVSSQSCDPFKISI